MEQPKVDRNSNLEEGANKKKYAVLFAYCGTNYHGSQANKNTDTIDDALITAFHKAGIISDLNFYDENKYIKVFLQVNGWGRAARTDKGVHAAGNVIHCKLAIVQGKEDEAIQRINDALPTDIRVFKMVRTTKNFNAKNFCDRRLYEYILPVSSLSPAAEDVPPLSVEEDVRQYWEPYKEYLQYEEGKKNGESLDNPFAETPSNHQRVKSLATAQRLLAQQAQFDEYTPDAEDASFGGVIPKTEWPPFLPRALSRFRACLSLFVGTHNFHNYTVSKSGFDASAQRHLLSITVSDPIAIRATPYLRVRLDGQSFMLHQIRKMIGMGVEVARGKCALYTVAASLGRGDMITPLAPSAGLFLDQPLFCEYNKKQSEASRRIDLEDAAILPARCAFKKKEIYEHIDDQIRTEDPFSAWLEGVDRYNKEYCVTYPKKEEMARLEEEARVANKMRKQEKDEKWEKKRKIENPA